jgi:hypothetical protein
VTFANNIITDSYIKGDLSYYCIVVFLNSDCKRLSTGVLSFVTFSNNIITDMYIKGDLSYSCIAVFLNSDCKRLSTGVFIYFRMAAYEKSFQS